MNRLSSAARATYAVYAIIFVCSGTASALLAHLEMGPFLALAEPTPDLMNQYRFLRASEIGFGLLMWTQRHAFFSDPTMARLLGAVFVFIPLIRAYSFVVDGIAGNAFVFLMVAELVIAGFLISQSGLLLARKAPANPE